MNYIVLETNQKDCVVLDEAGRFIKAVNKNYKVGETIGAIEEVLVKPTKAFNFRRTATVAASLAACFVLVLAIQFLTHIDETQEPFASVYLTMNPELRVDIYEDRRVIDIVPLDEDGETLLERYDRTKDDFFAVTGELVDQAVAEGFLADGGRITITIVSSADVDDQWLEDMETFIAQTINDTLAGRISVAVEIRKNIGQSGLIMIGGFTVEPPVTRVPEPNNNRENEHELEQNEQPDTTPIQEGRWTGPRQETRPDIVEIEDIYIPAAEYEPVGELEGEVAPEEPDENIYEYTPEPPEEIKPEVPPERTPDRRPSGGGGGGWTPPLDCGCRQVCSCELACGCIAVCSCELACGCIAVCSCELACGCIAVCSCELACGCIAVCSCELACGCIAVCSCELACGCIAVCSCELACGCIGVCSCCTCCTCGSGCGCVGVCTCLLECGCVGNCTCPLECGCVGNCTCPLECGCVGNCTCPLECGCVGNCTCPLECGCVGNCTCPLECGCVGNCTCPLECGCLGNCTCEQVGIPAHSNQIPILRNGAIFRNIYRISTEDSELGESISPNSVVYIWYYETVIGRIELGNPNTDAIVILFDDFENYDITLEIRWQSGSFYAAAELNQAGEYVIPRLWTPGEYGGNPVNQFNGMWVMTGRVRFEPWTRFIEILDFPDYLDYLNGYMEYLNNYAYYLKNYEYYLENCAKQ